MRRGAPLIIPNDFFFSEEELMKNFIHRKLSDTCHSNQDARRLWPCQLSGGIAPLLGLYDTGGSDTHLQPLQVTVEASYDPGGHHFWS